MIFQRISLLGLLSIVILGTPPALGVSNQDSKVNNKVNSDRKKLEALLSKNSYGATYKALRQAGNKASDEELVKYLFEGDGYKDWNKLSSDNQKWVISKVAGKI